MLAILQNPSVTFFGGFILGILGNFVVSEIYWIRRIRIERPYLYIETTENDPNELLDNVQFEIINKGQTRALNLSISVGDLEKENRGSLESGDKSWIYNLSREDSKTIFVSFEDMWGRKYLEKWKINGSYVEDDDETGGFLMPAEAIRLP